MNNLQKQRFEILARHLTEKYPLSMTIRDVQNAWNMKSVSQAYTLLKLFKERSFITWTDYGKSSIELTEKGSLAYQAIKDFA